MIFRPKSPPKTIQNRSKGLPKASFFHLRFRLRSWYDFGSILAPKRPPFGRPFGAKVAPPKRSKLDLPKRGPQYAPRPPPRALKTPREAPKSLSRGAQDAPKTPYKHLVRVGFRDVSGLVAALVTGLVSGLVSGVVSWVHKNMERRIS